MSLSPSVSLSPSLCHTHTLQISQGSVVVRAGAEAVAAFRGEHQLHLFVSEAKAAALQARLAAE